jgi:hypothetical protein
MSCAEGCVLQLFCLELNVRHFICLCGLLLCRTLLLGLCGASCCDNCSSPTILPWLSRQQQRWRRHDSRDRRRGG